MKKNKSHEFKRFCERRSVIENECTGKRSGTEDLESGTQRTSTAEVRDVGSECSRRIDEDPHSREMNEMYVPIMR